MNTTPITANKMQDAINERIQQRALQVALHMNNGMTRDEAESMCGKSTINLAKFPLYEEAIEAHCSWGGYVKAKAAKLDNA